MKKVFFVVRTTTSEGIVVNVQLGESYTKVNLLKMEKNSWVRRVINDYINQHINDTCGTPCEAANALNMYSDVILIPGGEEQNPENWITFCHSSESEIAYVVASNGDTYERITAHELTEKQIEDITCNVG